MKLEDKHAKLLALSVLYENKDRRNNLSQIQRIACRPDDVAILLSEICDNNFKEWVQSVSHLFRKH